MSDFFKVSAASGSYGVEIASDLLASRIIIDDQHQIIICDEFFAPAYQAQNLRVISVRASEASKSLDQMTAIIVELRTMGANRNSTILAIGGGVIQDVATFVASLYMRGLKWSYFPTTLLGMVDSCIGGKSSINVGNYKNLIGSFYPPENIFIDLKFVETLSFDQKIAGLCEAVKICFADTGNAFERYIALNPSASSSQTSLQKVISLSLMTKRWFIQVDEHDQKERQLLNFGHTFGHAMEGASSFALPHGIAVGMGMLVAVECSRRIGHLADIPPRVMLLEKYVIGLLATVPELTAWLNKIVFGELMKRFDSDKKHTSTHFVIVVPDAEGHLIRLKLDKSDANRDIILSAFREVNGRAIGIA